MICVYIVVAVVCVRKLTQSTQDKIHLLSTREVSIKYKRDVLMMIYECIIANGVSPVLNIKQFF